MKKNIFIISYYFPPYGGVRVLRNYSFCNFLSKNSDYNIIVITSNFIKDKMSDFELYKKLNNEKVRVIPLLSFNIELFINKLKKLFKKNNRKKNNISNINLTKIENKKLKKVINSVFVPDHFIFFQLFNILKILILYLKYKPEIIITSSPPHSSHLTGLLLKKIIKNKIKWISDFRDPWIGHKPFVSAIGQIQKINYKLEKTIIKNSDATVSCVKEIIDDFKDKYPENNKEKYFLIKNGYEKINTKSIKNSLNYNESIKINYTGTFNAWRTPEIIIESLYYTEQKTQKYKFQLDIWGTYPKIYSKIPQKFNFVYNKINFNEHISFFNSLEKMAEADINLLIVSEREGKLVVTGKFSNYLNAGKPILALLPKENVIKDIINNNNFGIAVSTSDKNEIYESIICIIENYTTYIENFEKKKNFIEKYSRDYQNKKLLDVINYVKN